MPGTPGAESRPAVNLTWNDAVAYAAWAGKRLPSELEWEKSARGYQGRRYPWGNTFAPGRAVLRDLNLIEPATVGTFAAGDSIYGCSDMVGNVWEWTVSMFGPYPGNRLDDPNYGQGRVIRGGGYGDLSDTTTTRRSFRAPSLGSRDLGFRCVTSGP